MPVVCDVHGKNFNNRCVVLMACLSKGYLHYITQQQNLHQSHFHQDSVIEPSHLKCD